MIEVVKITNPFERTRRETERVVFVPGQPIVGYVAGESIDFVLNGNFVKEPNLTYPCDGDQIVVLPHVGGGSFRNILATVASMWLMGFAGKVANGAAGLFGMTHASVASYLAAGAVMSVGGRIINAVFPAQQQQLGSAGGSSSPTYGWDTPSPSTGEGGIIGVTYGECIPRPQVLESHVETVNGQQYLNLLLCGGMGPVENIYDIKIGGTPIGSFLKAQVETRTGTNDQQPISFFSDTPLDQSVNVEVTPSGASRVSDSPSAVSLEVAVEFPSGLYHIKDDGGLDSASIVIRLEYRVTGAPDWTLWKDWTISAAQNTAVRQAIRLYDLQAGRYEVRATMLSRPTGTRYSAICNWTVLTSYNPGRYSRPNKVLVGLRILATNQLSGGVPDVTWRQVRNTVYVWNPKTTQYETRSARNPIWAAYDIYHQCRRLRNISSGEMEHIVFGVDHSRLDPYWDEWVDAAAYADEQVPGLDGVRENRFEFDAFYDTEMTRYDAAQKAANVGHAVILTRGNNIGVVCDKPGTMVQIFGEGRTTVSSVQGTFSGVADRALAVEVVYSEQDNDFKNTQFLVRSAKWNTAPRVQDNPAQLRLFGVKRRSQAYREGVYTLANNDLVCQFVDVGTDIDAIVCQYGDIVGLNHSVPQLGVASGRIVSATATTVRLDKTVTLLHGQPYEIILQLAADDSLVKKYVVPVATDDMTDILAITTPFTVIPQQFDNYVFGVVDKSVKPFRLVGVEKDGDLTCKLRLAEYVEGVYSGDLNYPLIDYTPPGLAVIEVSGLSLGVEVRQGAVVINASWYLQRGEAARAFNVYYSADGGETWQFWEQTQDMLTTITGAPAPQTYTVKVCTYNGLVQSTGVTGTVELLDAGTAPPENLDYFSVAFSGANVILMWRRLEGSPNATGYEIRRGAVGGSWQNAQIVTRAPGKDTVTATVPAIVGATVYYVCPYNNGGYADTPLSDEISISSIPTQTGVLSRPDYQATAELAGAGVFVGSTLVQKSANTYATFSGMTYAQMAGISDWYGGVAGTVQFLGPIVDCGKVIDIMIAPVESWFLAPDQPTVYECAISSDGQTWTPWKALSDGFVTARFIEVRGTITGLRTPGIMSTVLLQVSAKLQTQHFPDVVIPVGGLTLTFDPPYLNKPAIGITPNNAILSIKKSDASNTAVIVQLFDPAGITDIGGVADVTAIGI